MINLVKVKFFNRILFEFIEKLGKAFPDIIDDVNVKTIIATLDPIKNDAFDTFTSDDILKQKSNTFKYMIQFYDNLTDITQEILDRNIEILNDFKTFKTPSRLLVDIDIDFIKLCKKTSDDNKKIILTYLQLLVSSADDIIKNYKFSNKSRKLILRNRVINLKMQTALRKKIYEVIGEDGKNATTDLMIDEIITTIQKSKHLFTKGGVTQEKIQNIMSGLHKKMVDKYEHGELSETDLKQTFKSLMKNILTNKDGNIRESIGSVIEMMKATGNDEMLGMLDENMDEETLRTKLEEIQKIIDDEDLEGKQSVPELNEPKEPKENVE
jgi:hypothetical protein